MRVEIVSKIL